MAYTTPVTDRTIADVKNKTSKAYFNVADWQRIYNNTLLTKSLAEILLSSSISASTLTEPTITTIPTVVNFNALLTNIETLRLAVVAESIVGAQTVINDAWEAGLFRSAPDWQDANIWESTIDAIWQHFDGNTLEVCPTLTANLTIPTDTDYIVVDCIDPDVFEIIIEGTGELHVI